MSFSLLHTAITQRQTHPHSDLRPLSEPNHSREQKNRFRGQIQRGFW